MNGLVDIDREKTKRRKEREHERRENVRKKRKIKKKRSTADGTLQEGHMILDERTNVKQNGG